MNDYVYTSSNGNVWATAKGFDEALKSVSSSLDGILPQATDNPRERNQSSGASTEPTYIQQADNDTKQQIGKFKISPWGTDNMFPNNVLKLVNNNNLAPGLLEFKEDMTFGSGLEFVDKNGNETNHAGLIEWLDSWDYSDFIKEQISDYHSLYNCFGKFVKTKRGDSIALLEHVSAKDCRKTISDTKPRIVVGDWSKGTPRDFADYPMFDRYDFAKNKPVSMFHHYRPSSGFQHYGTPKYIGVLPYWLPLASKIPQYHLSIIQNTLTALFHIQIPMEAMNGLQSKRNWSDKELDDYIKKTIEAISEMLTGSDNAGKTVYTYTFTDPNTRVTSEWKITAIDSKMKQQSEGYLKLYNDCNQALTSAFQVQPSLACIQLGDKMSSGSEVLNSYNLHMLTRTPIPREIILKSLQIAININFKGEGIVARFKNAMLVKQETDKTGILQNENADQ